MVVLGGVAVFDERGNPVHPWDRLEAEDRETFATLTELPATFARTSEAIVGAGQVNIPPSSGASRVLFSLPEKPVVSSSPFLRHVST